MVSVWETYVVLFLVGVFFFYPSEKYESQLGWLFPIYGKMKVMFQTTNQVWYIISYHFLNGHLIVVTAIMYTWSSSVRERLVDPWVWMCIAKGRLISTADINLSQWVARGDMISTPFWVTLEATKQKPHIHVIITYKWQLNIIIQAAIDIHIYKTRHLNWETLGDSSIKNAQIAMSDSPEAN